MTWRVASPTFGRVSSGNQHQALDAVFQFDDEPFRRFATDAGQLHQARDVGIANAAREIDDIHARQQIERELRTHAADLDQRAEQVAFAATFESVQASVRLRGR